MDTLSKPIEEGRVVGTPVCFLVISANPMFLSIPAFISIVQKPAWPPSTIFCIYEAATIRFWCIAAVFLILVPQSHVVRLGVAPSTAAVDRHRPRQSLLTVPPLLPIAPPPFPLHLHPLLHAPPHRTLGFSCVLVCKLFYGNYCVMFFFFFSFFFTKQSHQYHHIVMLASPLSRHAIGGGRPDRRRNPPGRPNPRLLVLTPCSRICRMGVIGI